MNRPRTLLEAIRFFSDPDVATQFAAQIRWPEGPICPRCGGREHSYLTTRRLWKCKAKGCRYQFSVKKGTIFEDSPLGFDKWLPAVWLAVNCKNGVSSHELARALGVHQQTAWFMLGRIRLAMQTGSFEKASGEVEVDESFIGGLARNMHSHKWKEKIRTRGAHKNKTVVLGVLQRGGEVRSWVVPDRTGQTLQPAIRQHVAAGSAIYSDSMPGYQGLAAFGEYRHEVIDHAVAYVNGRIHTNGLENFWSLLKRGLKGTYISVEPFHLFRYIDEQAFRYNARGLTDGQRFATVLGRAEGRRVTYKQLTGR